MALILAADDSLAIRTMLKIMLSEMGHTVELMEDGQQAIEFASAHQADMVITDLNMPNKSGMQVIEAVKQLPNYKYVPILVMTTETASDKKAQAKAAGASGWLSKPVTQERLTKAVNKLLN
ncbi:MAG: response regulator [Kangiellaceae bacterium]|jgi:two-component system chemotaxis response regulator CheY|nr:response regulator [Kangiellaceae bacterium]